MQKKFNRKRDFQIYSFTPIEILVSDWPFSLRTNIHMVTFTVKWRTVFSLPKSLLYRIHCDTKNSTEDNKSWDSIFFLFDWVFCLQMKFLLRIRIDMGMITVKVKIFRDFLYKRGNWSVHDSQNIHSETKISNSFFLSNWISSLPLNFISQIDFHMVTILVNDRLSFPSTVIITVLKSMQGTKFNRRPSRHIHLLVTDWIFSLAMTYIWWYIQWRNRSGTVYCKYY